MIHISVTDTDGSQRKVSFEKNPSGNLMEILTEEEFDVPAICGGLAGCGTCHIKVVNKFDQLEEPEDEETFMLDSLPNVTDESRLSCQLALTQALDGAEIVILGDGV